MIQLPIIGAVLEASGMILEKKVLKEKKVNYKNYTVFSFFAIILVSLRFLYFFWRVDDEAFSFWSLMVLAGVVVASILANLFTFYALKREDISEFEHLWLMQPFFTIILAFVLFPIERNITLVGIALFASAMLVLAHVKKRHLVFDKYVIAALLGGFFFAVELVISRFVLDYYSPFAFYFVRSFFIFVFAYLIFRPKFGGQKGKIWWIIFATGLIWVIYRAIIYYGYVNLGIVFTATLFMLSPVFLFVFAMIFLKEKPTLRQIVFTMIIFLCVAAAIILGR